MTFEQFTSKQTALLVNAEERDGAWQLTVEPGKLRALLEAAQPAFDYPADLTCVDEGDGLRVLYRLVRLSDGQALHAHVRLPRVGGQVPTASDLWRGFEWQEREVFDLFGVVFDGHPDLRRILTWEGFAGHPLLKDFPIDNDDSSWEIPEQTDEKIIDLLQHA
ncbi:MAG TPA: NADH-quinone oxidoreductase subunit C [Armatimonadota bacterium]|jgi:NADH:ubiquinone oxidoreductase subunit C